MNPAETVVGVLLLLGFGYGLWSLVQNKGSMRIDLDTTQEHTYTSRAVESAVEMYEQMDITPIEEVDDSHLEKLEELRANARKEWSAEEKEEFEKVEKERLRQYTEMAMGLPGQFDHLLKDEPEEEVDFKREAEEARLQLLAEREAWVSEFEVAFEEHANQASVGQLQGMKVKMVSNSREKEFHKRLEREGAETGYIQISLLWDNHNDLDLHVVTPGEERICFNKRRTACGGTLDVDMNARPTSKEPLENLVWWKQPPLGTYTVLVHHYAKHRRWRTNDPTFFQVRVKIEDEVSEYMGSISHGEPVFKVCEFVVAGDEEE